MNKTKLFSFLLTVCTFALFAKEPDPYILTKVTLQNGIFFTMSPAEKQNLFEKVKLLHEIPEGALLQPDKTVNIPFNEKGKTIVGSLQHSSIWHVKTMQKQKNNVVLMTAKNIDDVVAGLVLEPDAVILEKNLDPEKIKKILLDENTVPALYRNHPKKIQIKENYDSCETRAEGTDLRIMSYNILANVWGAGKMQIQYRVPLVAEIIKKVAPDFAGLQEVDSYTMLKKSLHPYKFITKPRNMCAIVYDSRKYREVKSDVWTLLNKPSGIRCLVWCLFEEISTGKQIIITNTHWQLSQRQRLRDAEIMAKYIADLQKMFPNVPIVCTGDFNTNVSRPDLQLFLKESGFKDAVETASVCENKTVSSYFNPKFLKKPETGKRHIDHIITTDDLIPLSAKLLAGDIIYEASDHLPIIADFKKK